MIQELKILTIEPIKRGLVTSCLKETNSIARNTYLPLLKKNIQNKLPSREKNVRINGVKEKEDHKLKIESKNDDIDIDCEKDLKIKNNQINWNEYKPKEYSILK